MVKKLLLKVLTFWALLLTSAVGWGQCVDGPNSNTSATITLQGSSTLSCSDQTISITGSENWDGATGGTFQWQEKIGSGSWQDISSETSIDLLNYLPQNNSQYRLLLVFCNGTTDENFLPSNISTTINTTQPAGSGAAVNISLTSGATNLCSEETVSFSSNINADGGTDPYTFQWETSLNGGSWTPIASETNNSLANFDPPAGDNRFRLVTTFCNGTVKKSSPSATITATQEVGSNASVTTSLTSGSTNLCSDETVSFSSSVDTNGGTDEYSLQWETSLNGGSWNPIASETTNNLTNFDPPAGDNRFRLVATFCDGTIIESSPSSTIMATQEVGSGAGISISLTSGATSLCSDETVSFSSTVNTNGGTDPYTLQWETSLNGGSWNPIASETTNSLTNFDPPAGDNRFRLVATFCDGTVKESSPSSTITATQEVGSGAGVSISLTSGATSLCSDETVSFDGSINLNGGTDDYTLRWEEQLNNGSWTTISSEIGENLSDYSPKVGNNRFRLIATFCDGSVLTSPNSQLITVNQVKTGTVSISASSTTICPGGNITFSATANNHGSGATYDWQVNGESKGSSSNFSSTSIPSGASVQLFMTSSLPCVEPFESNIITVTHKPAVPDTPGTITGEDQVCPNTSGITYSIAAVDRATSYQWTLPSGWSGTSTNQSITVTSGNVGDNQIISVKAINECGESAEQTISVNVGPGKPATPSAISDPGLICPGSSVTLNVTDNPAINSYTWTVPTGWNITNGQGTNEITITAGNYGQNGTVSVYSTNDCLDSDNSTKTFTINDPAPATPGTISGKDIVCPDTDITYSITAVEYADEYIWYYNGTEVSGQNGTSITVNSGVGGDKNVEVIAVNECSSPDFNSITRSTKAIKVDDGTPEPTSITLTHTELNNGETYFCPGETGLIFNVPADAKIDSYAWQVPSGWTITAGAGTDEITATAGQLGSDGQITFTGSSNDCGSVTATYDVYVKNPAPVITSETISGETEVCHDAIGLTYSIPSVQYATSYTWSVPGNWNVTSGDGTNSITVSAGTDDGNITVKANNDCGESSEIILNVLSIDNTPPALGTIFSDPGTVSQVCPPAEFDFWVDEVDGADSYSWTLPPGWEILSGENTSRIHIKVTNSAAYNNENVTVFASNICGDTQSVAYTDITVSDYIITDLGEDQTVCSTQTSIAIPGEISFGSAKKFDPIYTAVNGSGTTVTGNLSDLPTNTNSYPSNFTFYYNPTTNDIASGSVTISVQVPKPVTNKNDPDACGTGYAEMKILFRPDPTASITATPAICINQTAEISFTATPNTTVTYKIGSGANQTVAIDGSGTAIVTTGAFNTTTTISLVSIQYTQAPSCSKTLTGSATVTVNPVPDVDISYNTPYCHTDNVATVSFANEIGAWDDGTFSATGELGAVINTDGSFDPSSVTPNTYTITYTMPAFGGCEEISVTTDVKILEKVVVAQQPEDLRICEGGNAHFEVGATGDGLTYQWYKDAASTGNEISGATSATLDISNITPANAGDYIVVISGASPCSPINSEAATLTVDENIVINTQPEDLTVCENNSATFSFSATSGGTEVTSSDYTFQWYKGTPGSGTPVGGATLANFTIDPASPSNNGDYYVEITGPSEYQCGPTLSESATLTVMSTPTVEISGTSSICSGNSAYINFINGIPNGIVTYTLNNDNINSRTFSLDASGEGTLNTGNLVATDSDNDGELDNTEFEYKVISVAYPDSPDCSSNVSGSVTITVSPVPNPQISFPNNQIEFCTADGAVYTPGLDGQGTFTGGTFSANGSLNINSSTGAFIPSNQDSGDYIITYSYPTAGGCSEGSTMLNISIYEEVKITSDPFNVGICSTQDAEFSVTATGDDLSFQWYKDGSLLPGETAATLSLPVATSEDAGEYYVMVSGTNACTPDEDSQVESAHAFLTVDEDIVIIEPGDDVRVCDDTNASVEFKFIAHASGEPLTFTWIYADGSPVDPENQTNMQSDVVERVPNSDELSDYPELQDISKIYVGTLTINNITAADQASYAVKIDGSGNNFNCAEAISNSFNLDVDPLPTAPTSTASIEYCFGETAEQLTVTGESGATFTWYDSDNNELSGPPTPDTSPEGTTPTTTTYYVTQKDTYCESPPTTVEVVVYGTPAAPVLEDDEKEINYCLGDTATQLAVDLNGAVSANWYDSESSNTPLDEAPTPQTTAQGNQKYWVTFINDKGCESDKAMITVYTSVLPEIVLPEDQEICEGDIFQVTTSDNKEISENTTTYSWNWKGNTGDPLTGAQQDLAPVETTTFTVTATNANGCTNTAQITINVDPQPAGGMLEGPTSVCITNPAGDLDLSNFSGSIVQWESKAQSASTWTAINENNPDANYQFNGLTETTSYRVLVGNGVCEEVYSNELAITVDPEPVAGQILFRGTDRVFMMCEFPTADYFVPLQTTGSYVGDIVAWQYRRSSQTDWQVVKNSDGTNFTGTELTGPEVTAAANNETTLFRVEVGSGACSPNVFSDNATLSIIPSDIAPNPVTITRPEICIGESIQLSSGTGYGGYGTFEGGAFDNSSIANHGWRVKRFDNDTEYTFQSAADNTRPERWMRTNPHDYIMANPNGSGTIYQRFDSSSGDEGNKGFAIVSGDNPSTLETPVFNTFTMDNPTLTFDQAYNLTAGDTIKVQISLDGGNTYIDEPLFVVGGPAMSGNYDRFGDDGLGEPNNMVIDLSQYAGLPNLRIRWLYDGSTGGIYTIDDIGIPQDPDNVELIWYYDDDPNDPNNPLDQIGEVNQSTVTYTPTKIGWNYFQVNTALVFDTNGDPCQSAKNMATIQVYVFDSYTTTATANIGSCGSTEVPLTGTLTGGKQGEITGFPVDDASTIAWTVVSGPDGYTFSESHFTTSGTGPAINDPNAIFTPPVEGQYTLSFKVTPDERNSCTITNGEVTFNFAQCTTLDFDGVDDHVIVADSYSTAQTIETWIRPETENGPGSGKVASIFSSQNYELFLNTSGSPVLLYNGKRYTSSRSLTLDGRWYHIAVVLANPVQMFIDGIEVNLPNTTSSEELGTGGQFVIGGRFNGDNMDPDNYFSGWIDEFRIWNTPLTEKQIRFMMNQRIKLDASGIVASPLSGEAVPNRSVAGSYHINGNNNLDKDDYAFFDVLASSLIGYYRLISANPDPLNIYNFGDNLKPSGGLTPDHSSVSKVDGRLYNIETDQQNTSPTPYVSIVDGQAWATDNTWAYHEVWDAPNSIGIDESTPIDWNIARVNHNIFSSGKDIVMLGILSETPDKILTIDSDRPIRITHYLLLDGNMDLIGESQLLQDHGSILAEESAGWLQRDQQGKKLSYNYNYWSSPVSAQGSTPNNAPYTIFDVLRDPDHKDNPNAINYSDNYAAADGAQTNPMTLSTYWMWKFKGSASLYADWEWIGATESVGTGEGYTMKGTDGTVDTWDNSQNYTFKGKPHNGNLTLDFSGALNHNYLIGNPYPSALDADKFIQENLQGEMNIENTSIENANFNGTIYFWSHFAGKSHYLQQYVGGYAALNLAGGVQAASSVDQRINNTGETSEEPKPEQFIPVGQGFFVNKVISSTIGEDGELDVVEKTGGESIILRNTQREFETEASGKSVFQSQEKKTLNSSASNNTSDGQRKIWLKFKSPMKYHRQLLVTADPKASSGFDLGYDAPLIEDIEEDMYWSPENYKFVIQGVNDFDLDQELNLEFKVKEKGELTIKIDELRNIPDEMNIFLRDSLLQITHDLRGEDYTTQSEAGIFSNRFKIVFQDKWEVEEPLEPEEPIIADGPLEVIYVSGTREVLIKNPELLEISRVYLNNMLGQQVHVYYDVPEDREVTLPVQRFSAGVYIVKMHTEKGIIVKKVILE